MKLGFVAPEVRHDHSRRRYDSLLCHAHIILLWDADRDSVRALYTRLTQEGVDVSLDKEKLLPGQDWELEIRKAVCESV